MEKPHKTARDFGHQHLYHYEPFNPKYLAATLREHEVHFSDPTSLNDPWDCRPWFHEDALEEPTAANQFIDWIFSFTTEGSVTEAKIAATKHKIRTNAGYRRALLKRWSEDFQKLIPQRWKIYCLTPVPDSTLMWSHYGANHTGVCLEFGTDFPLFGAAVEVKYLTQYPKWSPHTLIQTGAPEVLLTKSDDWSHEHEFRIIAFGAGMVRPFEAAPLILRGNFLSVPVGAIKSVIVGCKADHEYVARIIRNTTPHMRIKRAIRSPDRYRLIIEG